jgi:hypothetical protein
MPSVLPRKSRGRGGKIYTRSMRTTPLTLSTKRGRNGRGSCIRVLSMMKKKLTKVNGRTRMGIARMKRNPRLRRKMRRRGVNKDRSRGMRMID